MKKYPDALIFISLGVPLRYEVQHDFTENKHIPPEKICCYREVEYRYGCENLDDTLFIRGRENTSLQFCCMNGLSPHCTVGRYSTEHMSGYIQQIKVLRENTLKDIQNDNCSSGCVDCFLRRKAWWAKDYRIREIKFVLPLACNFRCYHCVYSFYDKKVVCAEMVQYFTDNAGVLDYCANINLAAGELAVQKDADETLNKLLTAPLQLILATNASVYKPQIEKLLAVRHAIVTTSVDAGTRETFKKIKGLDVFDKVRDNIIRYGKASGDMRLKYILFDGLNDNKEDIDGFLQLVKDSGINRIILSLDVLFEGQNRQRKSYGAGIKESIGYFLEKFGQDGYDVYMRAYETSEELISELQGQYPNLIRDDNV
jgi:pyruvate-formate lyase-activating enzyme